VNRTEEGREEVNTKLLASFVKNHRNTGKNIRKALDEGDIKLAHRLAHTLKGTAGLVGRTALQKIAHDMERALANGDTVAAEGFMGDLERIHDETIAELESLTAGIPPAAAPSKMLNAEQALSLIERLEPLLKTGNLECLELIGALHAIDGSGILIEQIEDFDFESAFKTLEGIKQTLESQL
jgi:HPt (histidine-containing phosphotransfer) domain-containing protein